MPFLKDLKPEIKLLLVVAAVSAVLAVAGILLVKNVSNQVTHTPPPAQQTPPPAPSPQPSAAPATPRDQAELDFAGWQTYRSDEFGFELEYPESWKFVEDQNFSAAYFGHTSERDRTEVSVRTINKQDELEGRKTQLKYEVDLSRIPDSDRGLVMKGLEVVAEIRLGKLGIDNIDNMVVRDGSGSRQNLLIEFPQTDVTVSPQLIAQTPFLEILEAKVNYEEIIENNYKILESGGDLEEPFQATPLSGRFIEKIEVGLDGVGQQRKITLWFDAEGTDIFRDITARQIGNPLAIYIDGTVITAPIIQQVITDGKVEIIGGFNEAEIGRVAGPMKVAVTPPVLNLLSNATCTKAVVFNEQEGWKCEGESWSARGTRISPPSARYYGIEFERNGNSYEISVVFEESQRRQAIELFDQILATFRFTP